MVAKPLQGIPEEDERDRDLECRKRAEGLVGDRIQGPWEL
jgi:hypothetical protein